MVIMESKRLNRIIVLTCILGILVSTYSLYVEMAVEARPGYTALCDISEYAKCSRVLSSEYSKGFGFIPKDSPLRIPNPVYGIIFYCLLIFITTFDELMLARILFVLATTSMPVCVYLAYLLAFVIRDLCVVCITTYFINGALVILTYKNMNAVASKNKKD